MRLRKQAIREGFKAALRMDGTWVYFETIEDAKEEADSQGIEIPYIMDIIQIKRVLI